MNGFATGSIGPDGLHIKTYTFESIDGVIIMSQYVNNVFKSSERII